MCRKAAYFILASIIILSLVLSSCGGASKNKTSTTQAAGTALSGNPHPPARTGNITTGTKVDAVTQSVAAAGGTIAISKPGDPLDGFVLDIPAGAYTGDAAFKISYAPITGQTFGSDITPISPMISIDNGGTTAKEMTYLRIPASVPEGYFAMGFIYDAKTKQLEGLPLVASDAGSVTIGTTHYCDIFLSMIDKALLKNDIESGFTPGVDDWQFVNRGSYIAPGGHCEGQSLTAMWYYCTKPDGSGVRLYGRYDNNGDKPATPKLLEDDSQGYRFASVVQDGVIGANNNFWENVGGKKWVLENNKWKMVDAPLGISDETTWDLFAYSMQATGEPQLVVIWSSAGGGHAMVVYRIKDGILYIADPNYPGKLDRRITYAGGKFTPYSSGANADEIAAGNGKSFETILYYAKSTVISWDTIAAYWAALKSKTAGDNKFPGYQLVYLNDESKLVPLTDGLKTPYDAISISAYPLAPGQGTFGIDVYRDGEKLQYDAKRNFDLVPGNNKLGILIWGKVGNKWKYVDFQYVNVVYGGLSITPDPLEGDVGKEYTFKALLDKVPDGASLDWKVNDVSEQNSAATSFTTTFTAEGDYTIKLSLLDSSGKELEKAQATAKIKKASEARANLKWETADYPPDMKLTSKSEADQGSANSSHYYFEKQTVSQFKGGDLTLNSKMEILSNQYFNVTEDWSKTRLEDTWKTLLNSEGNAEQVIIRGTGDVRQALLIKHNTNPCSVAAVAAYRYHNVIIIYHGWVNVAKYYVNGVASSTLTENDVLGMLKDEANARMNWVATFVDNKFAAIK